MDFEWSGIPARKRDGEPTTSFKVSSRCSINTRGTKHSGNSSFPSAQSCVLHASEKQISSCCPMAPTPPWGPRHSTQTPWLGRYPRPDDKGSGSRPGHWGPSQRRSRGPETFSQMQCEGAEGGDPGPWSLLGVLALPCPRASQTAVLGPGGRREGAGDPDSGSRACATHSQLWRVSPHPAPAQVEGATDWPSHCEMRHCAPVFPWARPSLRGSAPGTGPSPLSPARWR